VRAAAENVILRTIVQRRELIHTPQDAEQFFSTSRVVCAAPEIFAQSFLAE
jgi:hypothetical protein